MDQEPNKDSSAIKNGEKMITEVLALSYFLEQAQPTTSSDETSGSVFYVTGIVKAEMKTKVTYSLKLVLDGETGEVLQAHCEGPAGRGPTGKVPSIYNRLTPCFGLPTTYVPRFFVFDELT